jgi:hypothetical protein
MPAKTNTAPTALGGTKKSSAQPELNRTTQDLAMPHTPRHSRGRSNPELAPGLNSGPAAKASEKLSKMIRTREIPSREILFVDPGVSDIETILGHLRPQVEAMVLDSARPAARQIATALDDRHDLDGVRVIAHGAPGRISFAAGGWSAATVADVADDLAEIGRALAASGDLRLWSCQTAAGPAGAAFIAGLARASGADIAAATGRVGAAAFGGGWELIAASPPRPGPAAALSRRHCPICGSIGDKELDRPGSTLGDPTSGDWSVAAPTVILAPLFPRSLSGAATRERVSSCDPSPIIGKPSPGV